MKTPNMDLRTYAMNKRVRMWQIAQALNVSDNTFYRNLRVELDADAKKKFRAIVDRLAQEGKQA